MYQVSKAGARTGSSFSEGGLGRPLRGGVSKPGLERSSWNMGNPSTEKRHWAPGYEMKWREGGSHAK